MTRKTSPFILMAAVALLSGFGATTALADSAGVTLSEGDKFTPETGEALYSNVCQACHMEQGEGAVGAGMYPSLANNEALEGGDYPIYVILHGLRGMPPVGNMMSDEQVAAVVNYIRTNFGNDYKDEVTAKDVADNR